MIHRHVTAAFLHGKFYVGMSCRCEMMHRQNFHPRRRAVPAILTALASSYHVVMAHQPVTMTSFNH